MTIENMELYVAYSQSSVHGSGRNVGVRRALVILANTRGKGRPERPEIRDNDGVPVRSRTLVEVSWGGGTQDQRDSGIS